ncbi:cytochrome c biogenesis protein ResB [Streptomyces sp. ODS28]|uniref:cytochrome c biogenesis protein ResB n=1 Tax=Streptomyces sp. ODS28 TaxID=3136688 RepID=UPI0031ECB1D7
MSTTGAGPPGTDQPETDERPEPEGGATAASEVPASADAAEAPADAGELGDAGAQLSTAPVEDGTARPGSFGGKRRPGFAGGAAWWAREVAGWFRWMWRQLTSMRVALILLFLLSLGAIPGSVIPQTNVDQVKVENFHKQHDVLAPIYDKLQLFDVYTSVWFSAIYILLFVSLAGCIVPRTWQFVGQLRARPPRAPKRLDRMPAYARWETESEPEKVLGAARSMLSKRRFRVETSGNAVASEKGYLREAGNLLFHIALIVLLLAFAAGQLWKSDGGKLIVAGDGFSNTLTQYDDFKSGSLFSPEDLDSFGFTMKDFSATYWEDGPNKGTAKDYTADISYWEGADGKEKKDKIQPNHPLKVGDTKVFLQGNGYAPVVSVKDGQGHTAYRGPVAFLPQDKNLTSSGVVKVTDYRDAKNRKDQLGFQGFFVPTFGGTGSGSMMSQSPAAQNPVLFLTAYHGDLGLDYGGAQNVYQLDTKRLKQFKKKNGQPVAEKLQKGQSLTLPNGAGSLKFEGIKKWGQFQIVHQVGNGWALAGALAAIGGLAGSLFIQRRRVWVRAVPGADGRTVVELAGLGRSESAKLPEELTALAADMQTPAPAVAPSGSAGAAATPEPPEGAGK